MLIPYLKGSSPEAMLNDLHAVMKNKPMVGTYSDLLNRYTVKETPFSYELFIAFVGGGGYIHRSIVSPWWGFLSSYLPPTGLIIIT